jgi:hypothetical protein
MKLKSLFVVLSLTFILVPSSAAFAAMVYTDPFYGITEAINAQTKVLKDALTQQQIATLPTSCVQRLRADIEANDTYIRDTEKMIVDFNAKNAGKQFDAEEEISNASTLNHLYTLISVQKQRYTNWVIQICSQERQQQYIPGQSHQPVQPSPITCGSGTVLRNNRCLTYNESCRSAYGANTSGDKDHCYCASGYLWATDRKSCVVDKFAEALRVHSGAEVSITLAGGMGGSGGTVSGESSAPGSCDRMVLGKITSLGTHTPDECYTVWQDAVAAAIGSTSGSGGSGDEATNTVTTSGSVADTGTTLKEESPRYMSRIWSWFTGLFGF